MPTQNIREIDNTTSEDITYDDYVVLVPGGVAEGNTTYDGLYGGVSLFNNYVSLRNAVAYNKPTTTTEGTTTYTLVYPTDSGYKLALKLLLLGLKVLYVHNSDLTKAFDFSPYEDKAKYDIRFIVLGNILDSDTALVIKSSAESAIECAAERGEAIALIDIPESESLTTDKIKAWVNSLTAADVVRAVDTYDGTVTKENAFTYAGAFAPYFKYTGETSYVATSLAYLSCFATYKDKYPDWYAFAGSVRGVLPYTNVVTEVNFGDAEVAVLQKREFTSEDTGTFRAVNTLNEVRPYGNIVWGNRTLFAIDSSNPGLKASSFLNIRNLCCDIKKTLYRASRKYTFDPNSDALWINFTGAIKPLLEKMKAGQGIRGYKIIKEKSKQKATLKARIRIIPIEAVEDFDLTVEMTDSIVTVTE
jgi:hypothetical protein